MATVDLTLNGFMIGNMPSFNNAFGTKKTEAGKGCNTAENTLNMMMPFLRMRPVVVTANAVTSVVEADAVLSLQGSISSLTLSAGAYKGVELKIINEADDEVKLLNGSKTINSSIGEILDLRWDGNEWRVKTGKQAGDFIEQLPSEKSPLDKCLEGEWVNWSGRAVIYGISENPPPQFTDYYEYRQATPSIAANQRPVVCYHLPGSDWQLFQFKGQTSAYAVPEELDPVKWDLLEPGLRVTREECQKLATRNPDTREIVVPDDLAIGGQLTEGVHAGMYVTEVLVLGGKFISVEGGNRPTVVTGGVQQGRIPNIQGQIGKAWNGVWTLPTNGGYAGAIGLGPAISGQGIPGGPSGTIHNIPSYDIFDAARVVPTGPDVAGVNLAARKWRRVA